MAASIARSSLDLPTKRMEFDERQRSYVSATFVEHCARFSHAIFIKNAR